MGKEIKKHELKGQGWDVKEHIDASCSIIITVLFYFSLQNIWDAMLKSKGIYCLLVPFYVLH